MFNFSILFIYLLTKIAILDFNYLDVFYKLNLNDTFIFYFYFFWINYWYLVFFFTSLLLFILFKNSLNETIFFIFFLSLILLFYFLEISDHCLNNFQLSLLNLNLNNFNLLLLNNFNKVHPFIFYMSVYLIFLVFFHIYIGTLKIKKFVLSYIMVEVDFLVIIAFLLNLDALLLGAWWALQEGTWGGWWNWDPSETFGLLFMFSALLILHTNKIVNHAIKVFYKITLSFFIILFFYYTIQLNFELTSHNFGIRFFFFFNNNFLFIESMLIFWFISYKFIKSYTLLFVRFINKTVNPINSLFFLIFFFMCTSLLFLIFSFNFLFTYFFWKFFKFNFLNFEINYYILSVSFSLLIFFFIFSINYLYYYSFFILIFLFNFVHLLLTLSCFSLTFFYFMHYFVLNFYFFNITSLYINALDFELLVEYSFFYINKNIFIFSAFLWSCDAFLLDFSSVLTNSFKFFNTWSLVNFWKTASVADFLYVADFSSFQNFFIIEYNHLKAVILIESFFYLHLLFLSFIVIVTIYFLYNQVSLICV